MAFNWDQKPLYNVIARIPGSTFPDDWIIRGNHHDAWVNGADDPVCGMSAELEEARALGELRKQGWRPKRTIVYAAWDGEEPGLLGSTEWAEAHADDLKDHAVVYINTDGNGRGFLRPAGRIRWKRFVNGVARDVTDPETGISVWIKGKKVISNHFASPKYISARWHSRASSTRPRTSSSPTPSSRPSPSRRWRRARRTPRSSTTSSWRP